MKIVKMSILGVSMGLMITASAVAQQTTVQQTAFDYDYYYAAADNGAPPAAPAEEKASPAPAAAADTAGEETYEYYEAPKCRWCRDGELGEAWTLPLPEGLKNRNVNISGWLEGGIYGNQYGAADNGPIGFRNVGDGFTADQLYIYGERKTDTGGCGWDVGGRVDFLFGADGQDVQAFGDHTWDYGWNTSRDYGSALPQAYVEVAYNDLSVKMGRFYTIIGYEVVPATQNFFYSHSYMMYYAEPFTHSGALATYKANDKVTYYGGWTNGWDEGIEGKDCGSTLLGGIGLTLSEKASLTWACSAGRIGLGKDLGDGTIGADGDIYMNSFVFTYNINDKWTYVLQHDLGTNYNVNPRDGVDNQWYGLSNYLFRKVNDCLSYGGRIEWFQDPQGMRISDGECPGNYYELTAGFNYKPHANVLIRPELRYDWYNAFAGATSHPFNNNQSDSQVSFGTDFIFTY